VDASPAPAEEKVMKRLLAAAVLIGAFAGSVYADVTMKMTTTGPAMAPGARGGRGGAEATTEVTQTWYIKDGKARIDMVLTGHERSTILDPAARQMIALNPDAKEATISDLTKVAQQAQQVMADMMDAMKVSMTPTGQTKQLLGQTCTGYMLSVTMPMGGRGDSEAMTMTLSGPVWIAKDAPGTKDFVAFYKAAAESGLFLSAVGRGGQPGMNERGMAAMYKALSQAGGIPYEQELQVKLEGTGPMADMARSMGQLPPTVTKVTSVSTDPISDDLFQIPAGYARKNQ
jgi:hypothetical protein